MSMPSIPKEPHRPNRKEVAIDLLESIALEEIALSHIMNAEAEKIQAFVGKHLNFPTHPESRDIIKFNKGVNQLLETIVMKEWLLLKKLENVMEFMDKDKHHHHDESSSDDSSSDDSSSDDSSSDDSSSDDSSSDEDKHHDHDENSSDESSGASLQESSDVSLQESSDES
ncbi:hypothetical protein [Peribacillus asahii]|uniref:hypothetical protein n=1 Tax=Peribacillus asahii TaxID=228899 RepID=UPI00382E6732